MDPPGEQGPRRRPDARHRNDLGQPEATDLAGVCEHAALKLSTVADPHGGTAVADTVRGALTRTLAIALLAARASGKYDWTTPLDLDQLVTDTAWDHLDSLGEAPPEVTAV